MNRLFLPAVPAVVCLLAAGCGPSEPAGRPARVPAGGVVLQDQQPVAGATVLFMPVGQSYGATAVTDEAGQFRLTTFTNGDGAIPGRYQVTVRKVELVPGSGRVDREGGEGGESGDEGGEPPPVEKFLTPEKYASAATSGLEFEVTESGDNDFTLNLD